MQNTYYFASEIICGKFCAGYNVDECSMLCFILQEFCTVTFNKFLTVLNRENRYF